MADLIPPAPVRQPVVGPTSSAAVSTVLASAYGLTPIDVRRLPIGDATVNYRVVCAERTVFVKRYLPMADLTAELAAIELSALAGRAAVPVAHVLPARSGAAIAVHGEVAMSVWDFIDGSTVTTGLNRGQLQAAGAALGRIHRRFADLPISHGPAPQARAWLSADLDGIGHAIDHLLGIIALRNEPDDFDVVAARTLRERRAMLAHVPALLAALPPLSSQVLHGDYSVLNLLFSDSDLSAVIDFRPPDPFLIAYELGRIAFDPRAVTCTSDWPQDAGALVEAYLDSNPRVSSPDIVYSSRIWLVQLLTSLYGVKEHYLKPGLLQNDLDAFWLLRHQAAQVLWEHRDDTADALRAVAPD